MSPKKCENIVNVDLCAGIFQSIASLLIAILSRGSTGKRLLSDGVFIHCQKNHIRTIKIFLLKIFVNISKNSFSNGKNYAILLVTSYC